MDSPRTCPFCGGRALRMVPLLDGARLGVKVAGTGLSLKAPRSGQSYLHCNGCMIDYIRADRGVETVTSGLLAEPLAALRARLYYGEGVSVSDLLHCHCTGMARRVRPGRSLASVSVVKGELLACFSYGGVRTYGSLVLRRTGGIDRYVLRGLGRA